MFTKPLYSITKYDGCIVKGANRKVKKLVLVYHPEGSMHCTNTEAAKHCDEQWNLAADILHLRHADRSMLYRRAARDAHGPNMTKLDWELRWAGYKTVVEMSRW